MLFAKTPARSATATHGNALTFETVVADEVATPRVRPEHDTLLRVISGVVRLVVEGEDRLLATGEETIVPAGAVHRFESAYGAAQFVTGFRPAATS